MESNFGGFDPTFGSNLIVLLTMFSAIKGGEIGQIKKQIELKCQGSRLRSIVSGMKFAASEVKRMQICRE